MAKPRVELDMSVESVELLQRALFAHLAHIIGQAAGLEALEDREGLQEVMKDYFHGKALLKKIKDGRSLAQRKDSVGGDARGVL